MQTYYMLQPSTMKIGFMASGGGTNMQAVIDACENGTLNMIPAVLVTNKSKAGAVQRAANHNIPSVHISEKTHPENDLRNGAIIDTFKQHGVNLVVCVGYLKKVEKAVIEAMDGHVINIHPGPLPQFGGQDMHGIHVHEAVLKAGEKITGPTVHLVDEFYDHGPTLNFTPVDVLDGDTPETLQKRVLEQEYPTMIKTLQQIASGELDLQAIRRKQGYHFGKDSVI